MMHESGSRPSGEIPPLEIRDESSCNALERRCSFSLTEKNRSGAASQWKRLLGIVKHTLRKKKSTQEPSPKPSSPPSVDGGHTWNHPSRRNSYTAATDGKDYGKGVGIFSFEMQGSVFGGTGDWLHFSGRSALTEEDIHKEFSHDKGSFSLRNFCNAMCRHLNPKTLMRHALDAVPIISTIRSYKFSYLGLDLLAGISAVEAAVTKYFLFHMPKQGVMAIPQGMSYALLARLPPQYGLYVNMIYPFIYMIFGSTQHVVVGVSAIENMLLGESVSRVIGEKEMLDEILQQRSFAGSPSAGGNDIPVGLAVSSTPGLPEVAFDSQLLLESAAANERLLQENRIAISVSMSLCVGLVYMVMRLLSVGLVADLLASPVLSAFSTASAFLIGTSQLKHALGIQVPPHIEDGEFSVLRQWWYFVTNIRNINWVALTICCSSIVILAVCKFLNKRYFKVVPIPGPLLIVIIFTAVSWGLGLDQTHNLKVVGAIPSGLPNPQAPNFSVFQAVISGSDTLALVQRNVFLVMMREAIGLAATYFVIHISIAKTIAQQKRPLIGGDSKVFSRSCLLVCRPNGTAVVSATDCYSAIHHLSNSLLLILTVSFITPLLFHLPGAVLGAVVLFGVYSMVDFKELKSLVRIGGPDLLLWLVCFSITVALGAMQGIVVSLALSLLWLLRKTARPAVCVLGRLPQTTIYRNIKRFPMAVEEHGIRILRIDASLNFSNAAFFESRVQQFLLPTTRIVIIDGSSINDLDVTAIRMLERLQAYLNSAKTTLLFANWKGPMRDFLLKAKFYQLMPADHCFLSLPDAVFWAQQKLKADQEGVNSVAIPAGGEDRGGNAEQLSSPVANTGNSDDAFASQHLEQEGAATGSSCSSKQGDGEVQSELRLENARPLEAPRLFWDGLSGRSIQGLHVVTEITSMGQEVQWTVRRSPVGTSGGLPARNSSDSSSTRHESTCGHTSLHTP